MVTGIGKTPAQITTDDLRRYLTEYQVLRKSSRVTIDNIRRILSTFFSWLEDEDHIIKSPIRRVHKVSGDHRLNRQSSFEDCRFYILTIHY